MRKRYNIKYTDVCGMALDPHVEYVMISTLCVWNPNIICTNSSQVLFSFRFLLLLSAEEWRWMDNLVNELKSLNSSQQYLTYETKTSWINKLMMNHNQRQTVQVMMFSSSPSPSLSLFSVQEEYNEISTLILKINFEHMTAKIHTHTHMFAVTLVLKYTCFALRERQITIKCLNIKIIGNFSVITRYTHLPIIMSNRNNQLPFLSILIKQVATIDTQRHK